MKIAHLTTVHDANDNRIFYKECMSLCNVGYEVCLIAAGAHSEVKNKIRIIGFKSEKGRLKRFFKTSFVDLLKICFREKIDVYHFHDPEIIPAAFVLRLMGKIVVYDVHENNPASILSKDYIKSIILKKCISILFNFFEKSISRIFTAIVTARPDISEHFKHDLLITLRNFPKLSDLNHSAKEVAIKKNKPSVIFVGGITKIRGIYQLLEAFSEMPDYDLWLLGPIGDNELKNKIEQSPENIKYFGVVDANYVFSYIYKADIGIITFLPVPNHINTLATKPFEYMACGKPMVMSNFKYWEDFFQDSSLYVDPYSPKDIIRAIKKILNDNGLKQHMSVVNKKKIFTEYNWEEESKKLIDLYKKLELKIK